MSKPWVESVFGNFTNMFLHRILALRKLGPKSDANRLVKLNMFHSWVKECLAYKTIGQSTLDAQAIPIPRTSKSHAQVVIHDFTLALYHTSHPIPSRLP